jgi:dsDNA-specific endonuclease/ATPase MutS2
MASLYEIAGMYRSIIDMEPESDEEYSAMMSALDEVHAELTEKADHIVRYIRNLNAEAEALKAEEAALYKKRRAVENKAERLKAYLAAQMTLCGLKELKAGLFKLRFQPTIPAISITDESAIPEKFQKLKIEIDKIAIRDALKAGEEVPGIEVQRGEALVIR